MSNGDDGSGFLFAMLVILLAVFGLGVLIMWACNMVDFHWIKIIRV